MAVTKVVMPKLSDAMESGKIIKWLKKEGDRIQGGDIPLGAAVSLFMIPILTVAAIFILRDIHRRGNEA